MDDNSKGERGETRKGVPSANFYDGAEPNARRRRDDSRVAANDS